MKKAIIIFSRIPVPGQTKTRLMSYYSGKECAKIHQTFIDRIMKVVETVDADILVTYTPDCAMEKLIEVFGSQVVEFFPQVEKNLGLRMHHAFLQAFERGYDQVLLMGTDVPDIRKEILEDAFLKLHEDGENVDIVINPTRDGGYYLIGMKEPHEEIWKIEHYGGNTVLEDTIRCIKACQLSIGTGEELMDIDMADEYQRWKSLDTEACIKCGACTRSCLFLSKYEISLKELAKKPDLAYSCFLCGTCRKVCPKDIDGAAIAYEHRRARIKADGEMLKDPAYNRLMWEKNPYKFSNYKKGKKKSVLFPGCNFPSFYPKTTKSLEMLMKKYDIGVVYDCCGKPVLEAGLQKDADQIIEKLEASLKRAGVEEVIVLCPNCYYFLRNRISIPLVSIYKKLEQLGEGHQVTAPFWSLYLPCPDREERIFFEDLKPFIDGEIVDDYPDVQCCGLGGLAGVKEPDLAREMVTRVLEKANEKERPLYTYCASCISSFKRQGMNDASHLLANILGTRESMPGGIKPLLNRAMKKL